MPIHHATLHQLKIFDAVARHMSFARAAEELHLTPPALSIQVKQLAEAIGQPLFEQIGKKISLTATGDTSWVACRDVLNRLEQLTHELAALQGLEKGSLKLATLATAKYFIPRLLGDFCAKHPGVDTALFLGNREALLERLARNQDDLYILGQPPEHMNVAAEPFADNPLVVVARSDHPLMLEKDIAPSRLRDVPFILREPGSGTRLATEKFFERHEDQLHRPATGQGLPGAQNVRGQAAVIGAGFDQLEHGHRLHGQFRLQFGQPFPEPPGQQFAEERAHRNARVEVPATADPAHFFVITRLRGVKGQCHIVEKGDGSAGADRLPDQFGGAVHWLGSCSFAPIRTEQEPGIYGQNRCVFPSDV